jgi:hypothetical protein
LLGWTRITLGSWLGELRIRGEMSGVDGESGSLAGRVGEGLALDKRTVFILHALVRFK